MRIGRPLYLLILLVFLVFAAGACTLPSTGTRIDSQKIAEEFIKNEATFQFDGIPETLELTGNTVDGEDWQYTFEFDSRQAGYGDRSGQMLAQVITHHSAEITVKNGLVTSALMDNQWDMIDQQLQVEIKQAPIDEVKVNVLESYPPQISVYIKGGLPDGGSTFHDMVVTREATTINIQVTIQRPSGGEYPAIYTSFEKYVNLGSEFVSGTTYTLRVNDYKTTFEGTLIKKEGFAIYLTSEDILPDRMEMLSHINIADQPLVSLEDVITYNAQTHEIRLTDEAFSRIVDMAVPVRGTSFVVCVDRAPQYWGAFWTPVSSLSFDGVTIWQPLNTQQSGIISLELGYPGSSFYEGEDPRNNREVLQSLKEAEKLIEKLSASSTVKLPRSFKGYELYSWKENGQWHFTLITGTNRTKTAEEITSEENFVSETGWEKIQVKGTDAILDILSRLPEGETVFWCDEFHTGDQEMDFSLPPEQVVDEIRAQANQYGLIFTVSVAGD